MAQGLHTCIWIPQIAYIVIYICMVPQIALEYESPKWNSIGRLFAYCTNVYVK
jgi:hypothetical protein